MPTPDIHSHIFGKVAYVSYLDGDQNVHRIELSRCAVCSETRWVETGVENAPKSLMTDGDLHGTASEHE